jgi:hypothetical protein
VLPGCFIVWCKKGLRCELRRWGGEHANFALPELLLLHHYDSSLQVGCVCRAVDSCDNKGSLWRQTVCGIDRTLS